MSRPRVAVSIGGFETQRPSRSRRFAWLRARLGGYFYIACPLCGKGFAGFESAGSGWGIPQQPDQQGMVSSLVCWRCEGDPRADLRVSQWMYFGVRPFDWVPPDDLERVS